MSKIQKSKREDKKQPLKSAKEKKADKQNEHNNQPFIHSGAAPAKSAGNKS